MIFSQNVTMNRLKNMPKKIRFCVKCQNVCQFAHLIFVFFFVPVYFIMFNKYFVE